jgi:hypothetical protein
VERQQLKSADRNPQESIWLGAGFRNISKKSFAANMRFLKIEPPGLVARSHSTSLFSPRYQPSQRKIRYFFYQVDPVKELPSWQAKPETTIGENFGWKETWCLSINEEREIRTD